MSSNCTRTIKIRYELNSQLAKPRGLRTTAYYVIQCFNGVKSVNAGEDTFFPGQQPYAPRMYFCFAAGGVAMSCEQLQRPGLDGRGTSESLLTCYQSRTAPAGVHWRALPRIGYHLFWFYFFPERESQNVISHIAHCIIAHCQMSSWLSQ